MILIERVSVAYRIEKHENGIMYSYLLLKHFSMGWDSDFS